MSLRHRAEDLEQRLGVKQPVILVCMLRFRDLGQDELVTAAGRRVFRIHAGLSVEPIIMPPSNLSGKEARRVIEAEVKRLRRLHAREQLPVQGAPALPTPDSRGRP